MRMLLDHKAKIGFRTSDSFLVIADEETKNIVALVLGEFIRM